MTTHHRSVHLAARFIVLTGLVAGAFAGPAAAGQPGAAPAPPAVWDVIVWNQHIVWGQDILWGTCTPGGANIVWGNAAGREPLWLDELHAELEAIAEACRGLDDVPGLPAPLPDALPQTAPRREGGR